MRRIAISSGHGKLIRGAAGSPVPPELDERDENVRVVDRVFEHLQTIGAGAGKFHDDVSTTQSDNLNRIVNWHNSQQRDLDVSVHFNASTGTDSLMGTEVLYVTQQALAAEVSAAIADVADWPNRGAKKRMDLAFLNGTNKPAILIEVCFCDSTSDSTRYRERFEEICLQIAERIADAAVGPVPEPEPPEPEPEPVPPGEPAEIAITTKGSVRVTLNGRVIQDWSEPEPPEEAIPSNHREVIATVFQDDTTAYPPGTGISDTELAVSLPVNVADQAQRDRGVRVWNRDTNKSAVGKVRDKGPWLVDDDDYVFGDQRSLAETCYLENAPLPRGPHEGKVPNGAGIDLSPGLARAVGISGKGKVDWEFV